MLCLQQFLVAKGSPERSTNCASINRFRVRQDLHFQFLLDHLLLYRFDEACIDGQSAGKEHRSLAGLNGLQEFDQPACHGDVNAFEYIRCGDAS